MATLQGPLLRETCGGACGWSANRQGSSIGRPMRRAGPLHRVTLRFSTKWIVSVCCSDISLPQCYGSTTTRQSQKRGRLSFGGSSRQRAAGTSSASRLEVRAFTRSPPRAPKGCPNAATRRSRLRSRKSHIRIILPSSDSICLVLVLVAAHDLTDADFLNDAVGNVIVDVHSENSIATACLSGCSLHGWKRCQAPAKNNSN